MESKIEFFNFQLVTKEHFLKITSDSKPNLSLNTLSIDKLTETILNLYYSSLKLLSPTWFLICFENIKKLMSGQALSSNELLDVLSLCDRNLDKEDKYALSIILLEKHAENELNFQRMKDKFWLRVFTANE
jgi:hypothetical protein